MRYGNMELESPVAVTGFPSSGLVSSIAANYFVSQKKMQVVAGLSGEDMPPYCYIYNGSAYPPIRIYGYKSRRKNGKDMVVCLSEYAPKPEQCYAISGTLLEYFRSLGVSELICLEGIPRIFEEDKVFACGSGPGARGMLKKSRLPIMDNCMVKGITGVMLYDGPQYGIDVMAILVPGNQSIPDPKSAAGFLDPVSKLVTGFKVDGSALLKEAEEINRRIQVHDDSGTDNTAIYG